MRRFMWKAWHKLKGPARTKAEVAIRWARENGIKVYSIKY